MDQTWIAFGDIHNNTSQLAKIPGLRQAAGILISGDLTNCGGQNESQKILDQIRWYNPNVLAQIGNMDTQAVENYLETQGINVHARLTALSPHVALVGLGCSTPTPFCTPFEVSEEQLASWLLATEEKIQDFEHVILMSHTPPFGTATDRLSSGTSVGSHAVRQWIEKIQPAVCITGHIHESAATDTIGKTLILNPGDFASGGFIRIFISSQGVTARLEITR